MNQTDEPARPLWFKAVGFAVAMGLILLWWLWAQSLFEHAIIGGAFVTFLAVGAWANVKLGYRKGK